MSTSATQLVAAALRCSIVGFSRRWLSTVIGLTAGVRDTSFWNVTKRDIDTRKDMHARVSAIHDSELPDR